MSDATADGPIMAADGRPLKHSLARALRAQKLRALALIAPLLIFIIIAFLLPIVDMLTRSVDNSIVDETLPQTIEALKDWDEHSGEAPGEDVFKAFHDDLLPAVEAKTHTQVARRLNFEAPGIASLFRQTGRKIKRMKDDVPYRDQFVKANKRWGEPEIWEIIKRYSARTTGAYFLRSVDMRVGAEGIEQRPENERIFVFLFVRTLIMSLAITVSCLIIGYPVAFLLATLPTRTSNLLMILVLLPFWTSLLVRTSAWKVLLQDQGVINELLVWVGITTDESRLALINNQTGTIIAMTHILLPFMILPLYSVMKTIPPAYVRAAKSLGATNWTAFWRVYFPNSIPGIGAGAILVFILAIGYYITPEIVGGTSGVFISNQIAYYISSSSYNWGFAAALGSILLIAVLGLYWAYDKIVGIDNVKLG